MYASKHHSTLMSNQPESNYSTSVNNPGQSSQITLHDFRRLLDAIERESNIRMGIAICCLLPELPKEKQSTYAIAKIFTNRGQRVSRVTVGRWINAAAKHILKSYITDKGGEK